MADLKQFIFFDFEMLCSNRGMSYENMEAIRLGAVCYNLETAQVTQFDRYIKPLNKKPLSKFCKDLTGITDNDLLYADDFKTVFIDFLAWVGGVKKSRFFSWSTSDLSRLKIDAETHKISASTVDKIEKRYIDLQAIFTKRVTKTNFSVENALAVFGLEFVGEKHNPMYDSYNTLQIYLNFLNHPITTDLFMLEQFIFDELPTNHKFINKMIDDHFKEDLKSYLHELNDIIKLKDAHKMIKRTRKFVEKYENIVINRSGMFSEKIIKRVQLVIEFYHELLVSYEEHFNASSKIMIIDSTLVQPMNKLILKRG